MSESTDDRIAGLEEEVGCLQEDVRRLERENRELREQLGDKDRRIIGARGDVDRAVSDLRDVIRDLAP